MDWQDRHRRYEAGVWATPLALFPALCVSALCGQPSCLEPLVGLFVAHTPAPLATLLLNELGPLARPLALLGAVALLLPLGGLIAIGAPSRGALKFRRSIWWRWIGVTAVALALGLLLAHSAPTTITAYTALLAALLFPLMLLWTRTWRQRKAQPVSSTRRRFLRGLLGTPLVTATLLSLSTYEFWSTLAISAFSLGNPVRRLFAFVAPPARQSGFPVAGMEPEVTPVAKFYYNGKNATDPLLLAENWTVRITGLVSNPLTLTYAQLLALPRTDLYATLRCVDNPVDGHLMSTALWSGVLLHALLQQAQPLPEATTLIFRAADQFDEPFPLKEIVPEATLLAYAMNGESLTQAHGAPARVLLPGWFGFRNIKWIQQLEVTAAPAQGYWERNGWKAGRIHPVARVDVARFLDERRLLVAGVAFGGLPGVAAVQARINKGDWMNAQLNVPPLSPYSWVQWQLVLPVDADHCAVTARMVGGDAVPQSPQEQPVYPNGASGLHTIEVKR